MFTRSDYTDRITDRKQTRGGNFGDPGESFSCGVGEPIDHFTNLGSWAIMRTRTRLLLSGYLLLIVYVDIAFISAFSWVPFSSPLTASNIILRGLVSVVLHGLGVVLLLYVYFKSSQ